MLIALYDVPTDFAHNPQPTNQAPTKKPTSNSHKFLDLVSVDYMFQFQDSVDSFLPLCPASHNIYLLNHMDYAIPLPLTPSLYMKFQLCDQWFAFKRKGRAKHWWLFS